MFWWLLQTLKLTQAIFFICIQWGQIRLLCDFIYFLSSYANILFLITRLMFYYLFAKIQVISLGGYFCFRSFWVWGEQSTWKYDITMKIPDVVVKHHVVRNYPLLLASLIPSAACWKCSHLSCFLLLAQWEFKNRQLFKWRFTIICIFCQ